MNSLTRKVLTEKHLDFSVYYSKEPRNPNTTMMRLNLIPDSLWKKTFFHLRLYSCDFYSCEGIINNITSKILSPLLGNNTNYTRTYKVQGYENLNLPVHVHIIKFMDIGIKFEISEGMLIDIFSCELPNFYNLKEYIIQIWNMRSRIVPDDFR